MLKKPRLILAGAHSGVGKTSVSAGLMSALTRRGLTVQPYKVGPDYIDPAFHNFVTGRKSRNLDSWMLDESTIRHLFFKNAPDPGQGLSIIEGVMGLFDGHIESGRGSTADVAGILDAPIIMVINGSAMARSAAALVHGFNTFQPYLKLSGVIVNMVSGQAHYDLLKNYIEQEAGVPCFGYLVKDPRLVLESRHLGLVPSVEVPDLVGRLQVLAEATEETIDLDGLLGLAEAAPALPEIPAASRPAPADRVRIGLAEDEAFNFYYQDSLDLLTELGADLIPFSPRGDPSLPQSLDGLLFGGGFPEVFAADLMANQSLRREIKKRLEDGLPAYAECGGLMYLGQSLLDPQGQEHEMVGFFPHRSVMTKKLQNFGYVEVNFDQDTVLGPAGSRVRAHEFHHSRLEWPVPEYVLTIRKNESRHWPGGVSRKNVLAAYPHIHSRANPALAEHFVERCRQYKIGAKGTL